MQIKNRELTIKLEDLIDAIESVETEPADGNQDIVRHMYKTDLLMVLGFSNPYSDLETIKKELRLSIDNQGG